jgi:hypothetical protein
MIALFVAALVLTAVGGNGGDPVFIAGVVCFCAGMGVFVRWRQAQRASVFDQEEKTAEGGSE